MSEIVTSPTHSLPKANWTPRLPENTGLEALLLRFQSAEFQAGLGETRESFRRELKSLSSEANSSTLSHGLLLLATRLQNDEKYAQAGEIFFRLSETAAAPNEVRKQAKSHVHALQGTGNAGERIGVLLPRLAQDAFSLEAIAGMAGAGLLGRAAYAGLFSRLAGNAGWRAAYGLTGAKALAATGALMIEAPAFTLLSHEVRGLLNSGSPETGSWAGEMASAMLFLGVLRGTHAAAGRLLPGRPLFSTTATLTGIVASNRILQALELKPRTTTDSLLADSVASLLHFYVAERSLHGLLGHGYARFLRETEIRAASQRPTGPRISAGSLGAKAPAWEGAQFFLPTRSPDLKLPHTLQMASLKGRTGGAAKTTTGGGSRLSRKDSLRDRERLEQLQSRMEAASRLSELPSAKQINELKSPSLHRAAWFSRIDHMVRLNGEGTARLAIQRGFQAKPGRSLERDRRTLLAHLEKTLEAMTPAPTLPSPPIQETPSVIPQEAPESLPTLLDHLKEKSRNAGIWKFPELLATKLVKRIEAVINPRIREEAVSLFQAIITRVRQGSLESPSCVRLFICFQLALENKLEFQPSQWFLEPTATSPLLGSPSLGISPDPLPGKVILGRGQQGMIDFIRRYNLLAEWLTDAELTSLIQREGPRYAETLPGLRARQFREGVLQDHPHSTLAKNWNLDVGTVSSLLTERRKFFHIHLTRFIEELIIEKMGNR